MNAYLLDFYRHGQRTALARYNFVKENECFDWLNDFRLILSTLDTSMTIFTGGQHPPDPVQVFVRELSDSFKAKFNKAFNYDRR